VGALTETSTRSKHADERSAREKTPRASWSRPQLTASLNNALAAIRWGTL